MKNMADHLVNNIRKENYLLQIYTAFNNNVDIVPITTRLISFVQDVYRNIDTSDNNEKEAIKINFLGNNNHINERMFVTVDIYGKKIRALVDCGASRTIINSNVARSIITKEDLITYNNTRKVLFADKSETQTNGSVILPININKALWVGEIYMLNNLQYQMVLGK